MVSLLASDTECRQGGVAITSQASAWVPGMLTEAVQAGVITQGGRHFSFAQWLLDTRACFVTSMNY